MSIIQNFKTMSPYFSPKDCDECVSPDCEDCGNGTVRWEIMKWKSSIFTEAISRLRQDGACDGCRANTCYDCPSVLDTMRLMYPHGR